MYKTTSPNTTDLLREMKEDLREQRHTMSMESMLHEGIVLTCSATPINMQVGFFGQTTS